VDLRWTRLENLWEHGEITFTAAEVMEIGLSGLEYNQKHIEKYFEFLKKTINICIFV